MDVTRAVAAALRRHPHIRAVQLVGSRADGRAHELSDWDFMVETDGFESVARNLQGLVAPLRPLAEQWDPYSPYACYMLILPGPTKIDLIFPRERREWSPPWSPSAETLEAIDRHFWDWILWLEQKRRRGDDEILAKRLVDMYELLLRPMGVAGEPETIAAAVDSYLRARAVLEREFGVTVSRDLEREIRPVVEGASQSRW